MSQIRTIHACNVQHQTVTMSFFSRVFNHNKGLEHSQNHHDSSIHLLPIKQ